MALVPCRECGAQISTGAKACPSCGAKAPRFKWWLWISLGAVAAFFLLGFILSLFPEINAKIHDSNAITRCESEQRKALNADVAYTLEQVCNAMRENYKKNMERAHSRCCRLFYPSPWPSPHKWGEGINVFPSLVTGKWNKCFPPLRLQEKGINVFSLAPFTGRGPG